MGGGGGGGGESIILVYVYTEKKAALPSSPCLFVGPLSYSSHSLCEEAWPAKTGRSVSFPSFCGAAEVNTFVFPIYLERDVAQR